MKTIGLFVDFSMAYDSTNLMMLFRKLEHKKILNENQMRILKKLFFSLQIKLGNNSTKISNGVPQGSTISPELFAIFSEELITMFEK